ncbi:MAG: hypothetical protein J3K34DRAFT_415034 [Monoraphidium minutum]|nr:MAG: hypothetical protein J3K34DRAFT_415034 [Monoraphidium minutum]
MLRLHEDGCVTSQFENHVRAVLGWPLGKLARSAGAYVGHSQFGCAQGSAAGIGRCE